MLTMPNRSSCIIDQHGHTSLTDPHEPVLQAARDVLTARAPPIPSTVPRASTSTSGSTSKAPLPDRATRVANMTTAQLRGDRKRYSKPDERESASQALSLALS